MELDSVKLQTTWNDAAGSINANFLKIAQAIASIESSDGGGIDEEELVQFLEENGYTTQDWVEAQNFLKSIDSQTIIDALGYTPISDGDLSDYATIDSVASTYATKDEVTTLQQNDALQDEVIATLNDMFYFKDENTIGTKYNFFSLREISAGGVGTEGEGGGGGGGGADNLDGLLDVTISDYVPSTEDLTDDEHDAEKDSQVLGYDNASGQWVNKKTMYIHNQSTASAKWVITHNLGKMPNIKVIDSTGALVHGTVVYDTTDIMNKVTISFGGTFSGKAYLD